MLREALRRWLCPELVARENAAAQRCGVDPSVVAVLQKIATSRPADAETAEQQRKFNEIRAALCARFSLTDAEFDAHMSRPEFACLVNFWRQIPSA